MPAREYECTVTSLVWMTPTVFSLKFSPSKLFSYEPGQFMSVIIPNKGRDQSKQARRIYSFASSSKKEGYELCCQVVPGGQGSNYLASLKVGDVFKISAPFGHFFYETQPHRNACMIATSTGIGPFKAMVGSERFLKDPPHASLMLFGARNPKEILYPGFFQERGMDEVHAISDEFTGFNDLKHGFKGRVTDFLRSLPESWPWLETDFYLCGNGFMIEDVRKYLMQVRSVPLNAIHQEAYFSTHAVKPADIEQAAALQKSAA